MRITWGRVLIAIVVIIAAIQLVRPAKINPPIEPKDEIHNVVALDSKTADTIHRSCNDCHSSRTVWPWYSNIAPVSWLIVYDVNEGRRELNFSQWGTYTPQRRDRKLTQICKEVREGEMPGTMYPALHPNAKLSSSDVQALCDWTEAVRKTATIGAGLN
jgi:hypothetical protein